MIIGILSDIHGNLTALNEALSLGGTLGVNAWVCLGDMIDGGPGNNECARRVRDHAMVAVRGNHDDCFRDGIAPDVVRYLDGLPEDLEYQGMFLTHISPPRPTRSGTLRQKINDRFRAWNVFDDTTHRLVFTGHSHLTAVWSEKNAHATEAKEWSLSLGKRYHLPDGDRYIVSVGSLGYRRDSQRTLRFGTWNTIARMLSIVAIRAAPIHVVYG